MKTLLLALFISLSGFVTAQCNPTFSYSFDNATDKLTCWPNDTTGEHEWTLDNFFYFLANDGITLSWQIDTLVLILPYGHNEVTIGHGNLCNNYTETVIVDNLDGDYCDARFYSGLEPSSIEFGFYGAQNLNVNHAWIYGTDTISTDYFAWSNIQEPFTLTHVVYDNNGCNSSVTDTFNNISTPDCDAYFFYYPTNNGQPYEYTFKSYASNFLTHTWTFDGDTFNGYIFDRIILPGTHTICLTVSSDSCSDTKCTTLSPDSNNLYINVRFEDNTNCYICVDDASVYLYKLAYDDTTTYGVLVGSAPILDGYTQFTGLANGQYIVRAALNETNNLFYNYLPTYGFNYEYWDDVTTPYNLYGVDNSSANPTNILLLSVDLNPGSGLIGGGVVIEDTVRSIALENVMVYVKNQQGVITKYDLTDINGVFQLTNLAFGTYTLSADIPGYICPPQTVTINAQNPAFSEVELHLYPVTDLLSSLNQTENKFSIGSPYPNPTLGNLSIPVTAKKAGQLTLTIYNLLGQPVLSQINTISSGNQTIMLPTESLAQGIYILQIADKQTGAVVTKKIVKD